MGESYIYTIYNLYINRYDILILLLMVLLKWTHKSTEEVPRRNPIDFNMQPLKIRSKHVACRLVVKNSSPVRTPQSLVRPAFPHPVVSRADDINLLSRTCRTWFVFFWLGWFSTDHPEINVIGDNPKPPLNHPKCLGQSAQKRCQIWFRWLFNPRAPVVPSKEGV